MITQQLQKKIDRAIKLLQSIPTTEGEIEVAYSGGKDSDVILQLAKEAGIKYRAIYKCTTIDPKGTIAHAKKMGAEVIMPKTPFLKLIEKNGFPSMFARFCCRELKEYKVLDRSIQGIRRSESVKRAKRYQEPEECRVYKRGEKVRVYFPILDWTDEDVKDFILDRKIICAPVYYDEQGNFHVERRLGCIGCPLANKHQRLDQFRRYPNMVRGWCKSYNRFFATHPNSKMRKYVRDEYEAFVFNVFYDTKEDFFSATRGFMGNLDCKQFLQDYFHIKF